MVTQMRPGIMNEWLIKFTFGCKDTTKIAYMQVFAHFFAERNAISRLLKSQRVLRRVRSPSKTGAPSAPFRPLPQADTTVFTGLILT